MFEEIEYLIKASKDIDGIGHDNDFEYAQRTAIKNLIRFLIKKELREIKDLIDKVHDHHKTKLLEIQNKLEVAERD